MIVGTSTSCSASCGSRTEVRAGSSSMRILGTSITCSGTWISYGAKTSTNSCFSISGTGASSIGARMICSTVCRWIRSSGRPSTRGGGIPPVLGTSFWLRRASCAVPTWNEWWVTVASGHVDHLGSKKGKRALRAVTLESGRLVVVVVVRTLC